MIRRPLLGFLADVKGLVGIGQVGEAPVGFNLMQCGDPGQDRPPQKPVDIGYARVIPAFFNRP